MWVKNYCLRWPALISPAVLAIILGGAWPGIAQRPAGGGAPAQKLSVEATTAKDGQRGPSAGLVTVRVSLTDDDGRFVTGLKRESFSLFEDGVEREINLFNNVDAPLSFCLIVDLADSVNEETVEKIRQSISRFKETGSVSNEYFIMQLRYTIYTPNELNSMAQSRPRVFPVDVEPGIGVPEALPRCVERAVKSYKDTMLLMITDRVGGNTTWDYAQLRRRLKGLGTPLYTIGFLRAGAEWAVAAGAEDHPLFILDDISSASGGEAIYLRGLGELNDLFERWALQFRITYTIGFKSSFPTHDVGRHDIRIKVTPPRGFTRIIVRKRGYVRSNSGQ